MIGITNRQRQILQAVIDYLEVHKYSPTMRELCDMVGLRSPSTMYQHLEKLRRAGFITWEPSRPRTIKVIREDLADVNRY